MIDLQNTAEKITAARREKGFTQEELAARLGVTAQAVSKWERALGLPDLDLLVDVSEILGISLNDLLDKSKQGLPPQSGQVYDIYRMDLRNVDQVNPLLMEFGIGLAPVIARDEYIERIASFRRDMATRRKTGVLVPAIRIRDNAELESMACKLYHMNEEVWSQTFTQADEQTGESILLALTGWINTHLPLLVNRQMTKILLEHWRTYYPFAFDGVVPERISLTRLTMVLRELVTAGRSVWNLPRVAEVLDEALETGRDGVKELLDRLPAAK